MRLPEGTATLRMCKELYSAGEIRAKHEKLLEIFSSIPRTSSITVVLMTVSSSSMIYFRHYDRRDIVRKVPFRATLSCVQPQ